MKNNKLTIHEVNRLTEAEFISRFKGLFNTELCIPVISGAAGMRPFSDARDFLNCVLSRFDRIDFTGMLDIMRDNSILGIGLDKLSGSSRTEQKNTGLHELSAYDFSRFEALNRAYKAKFSFNFMCVIKGLSKERILASFEKRMSNDFETEFLFTLTQIKKLVYFRLLDEIEFTDDEKERCCFKYPGEYERYIEEAHEK
uniref:2-oxo-4-hydroxy-4-carboxy-5-ureidoimidazoline decarboxylase n=1 Tax=Candidatus Kentrum sp. FW TaxID=2126338 RepID=A0A450TT85_9GAMM|nr:MAG: OHCU decarboxylase [Candidatus Kentron sp. FW]